MKKLILAASILTLSACGGSSTTSSVDNFAETPVVEMKEQAKNTPNTLSGDKDNARYSGEALKGNEMEDPIPQK